MVTEQAGTGAGGESIAEQAAKDGAATEPGDASELSAIDNDAASTGDRSGRDPIAAAGESIVEHAAKDAAPAEPGGASDLSGIDSDTLPAGDRRASDSTAAAGGSVAAEQTAKDAATVKPSDAANPPAIDGDTVSARDRSGTDSTAAAGESIPAEQTAVDAAIAGDGQRANGTLVSGVNAGGGVAEPERIASVSVPTGKVEVSEESSAQTLNGILPLVVGVNEDGRFDFDQYLLRPEVKRVLNDLASNLRTADYDQLDVVGYTDRIGAADHNQRLSELRAWSVAQYLIAAGVPQNKIHYEGRGQQHPRTSPGDCTGLARDALIVCLQKDRRVEIDASIHRKHAAIIQ